MSWLLLCWQFGGYYGCQLELAQLLVSLLVQCCICHLLWLHYAPFFLTKWFLSFSPPSFNMEVGNLLIVVVDHSLTNTNISFISSWVDHFQVFVFWDFGKKIIIMFIVFVLCWYNQRDAHFSTHDTLFLEIYLCISWLYAYCNPLIFFFYMYFNLSRKNLSV